LTRALNRVIIKIIKKLGKGDKMKLQYNEISRNNYQGKNEEDK
jgi:hypothetical protein